MVNHPAPVTTLNNLAAGGMLALILFLVSASFRPPSASIASADASVDTAFAAAFADADVEEAGGNGAGRGAVVGGTPHKPAE